jgi:CRISPR-associated endonuclease/helicase Cas3
LDFKFWAHSDPSGLPPEASGAKWQPLSEHLLNASRLARQLAQFAVPDYQHFHDLAGWCGLLHDYGKYTDCFQKMIRPGGKGPCQHSIQGSVMAAEKLKAMHIAAVIAGHHAGLPDVDELGDRFPNSKADALDLLGRAAGDTPEIGSLLKGIPPTLQHPGSRFDLLTRMLLSCLVDADRLDTAGRSVLQAPLNAHQRLQTLLDHIGNLAANSPDGVVKSARQKVLEDCLGAASLPNQILSLSVPTGGGKTLSAMAFALQRAALQPERFRRIIIVIPFLSIIEQNAEVYARVFGSQSILEHHSGSFARLRERDKDHFEKTSDEGDKYQEPSRRPETENWDAPLVVTTSVRFFESLFSNHPSDLRRVHNISRSIIILDEVQVLPRTLLAPLLGMIDELCRDWGCSFVLSTATQPAFERSTSSNTKDRRWPPGTVREIISEPAQLHHQLRRVSIEWRITEPVDWPSVAGWMTSERQALCVVNLRDHAAKLFDELNASVKSGTLFHLSTRMCPAHRLKVIGEIRQRLLAKLPCLVVSTQLIEAGVDLDFPIAFRALGPLDSIVQVAGRADREGLLTAQLGRPAGRLIVFQPLDGRVPPNDYDQATGMTGVLAKTRDIQPDDLRSMSQFFEDYYTSADLGSKFLDMRRSGKFKKISDEFEMISSRMQDVVVPYGDGKPLVDQLRHSRQFTAQLRRNLQRYTVGLQPWEFRNAKDSVLFPLPGSSESIWIATEAAYDSVKGLQAEADTAKLVV